MKLILSMTVVIAAAVVSGYGQAATPSASPCTLKVAQAPIIRGLKLGMKTDEVLTMFPGSRDNDQFIRGQLAEEAASLFGVVSFNIAPGMYPGHERFAGINGMYFTFIDGRLVQYTVQYSRPPWPRLDDFINKTAEALKLPQADNWVVKTGYKSLSCDGFLIKASAQNGGGYLTLLTGEDPNDIQRQRRAAAEEQERRVFKP